MEISKFIRDAFKEGSLDKVIKGIEQLIMMMINAIGMIEQREMEMENHLEVLEEDIDLIKSFLLSRPLPLPGTTQPPSTPQSPPAQAMAVPTPSPTPSTQSLPPSTPPSTSPSTPPEKLATRSFLPSTGPTEDDITAFRKKLLKPTPKHEKPKAQPPSIRAALMQEIKEYFGTAMTKVKKEKQNSD